MPPPNTPRDEMPDLVHAPSRRNGTPLEGLNVGILLVLSIIGGALMTGYVVGSYLSDTRWAVETQQERINLNRQVITETNTQLRNITYLIAQLNLRLRSAAADRWRGEDMREWGIASERLNPTFKAPDLNSLVGYARRNELEKGDPLTSFPETVPSPQTDHQ